MRKLTQMDGRPISFDPSAVIIAEPHESGEGTLVRFGPVDRFREVHVREGYDEAIFEITESSNARAGRLALESFRDRPE